MTLSNVATTDPTRALFSRAANVFAASFRTLKRDDGSTYVALQADAPEWTRDAVMAAHDGELPNDLRYVLISDAATAIADQIFDSADEARGAAFDLAADLVPTYDCDLLAWFADRPSRLSSCDDALDAYGKTFDDAHSLLSIGYRLAAEQLLQTLISEIDDNSGTLFDSDYDCQLLISDSQGIYIPQQWCSGLDEIDSFNLGVDWGDVQTCQSGPEAEAYWGAWQAILDSAQITQADGSIWTLHQNGDLWAVRDGVILPEGF